MSFKIKAGILGTLISSIALSCPAFADTTLQGFICDQRGSVAFVAPTSHDKRFVIPGANKVAQLVDAQAQGPVGIVYQFNPPIPFQFVSWLYKESTGSNALRGINARYCVQRRDGSDARTVNISGGSSDRGGGVGDGWSQTVQDMRVFPGYVFNGDGVVSKIAFIFKDKKDAGNNITLGRVIINQNTVGVDNLVTAIGDCSLKDKCSNNQPE